MTTEWHAPKLEGNVTREEMNDLFWKLSERIARTTRKLECLLNYLGLKYEIKGIVKDGSLLHIDEIVADKIQRKTEGKHD